MNLSLRRLMAPHLELRKKVFIVFYGHLPWSSYWYNMVGRDRFSQLLPLQLPETISPSCPPSLPNTPDARKRAKTFSHSHPRLSIKYCDNSEELERDTKRQKPLSCAVHLTQFLLDVLIFICFILFSIAALCCSQGGERRQKPVWSDKHSKLGSGRGFWSILSFL